MKRGLFRSIVCGAVLTLSAAIIGCAGEEDTSTVAEALLEPSAASWDAPSDRATLDQSERAVDIVPMWAHDDGMDEESLRRLLTDLARRAALVGDAAEDASRALTPRDEGWQEEPSAVPL